MYLFDAIFHSKNGAFKSWYCTPIIAAILPSVIQILVRCLDIEEVGRGVAYAPGHANMSGEVTRRAALRGDGLSMMSKLA